VVIFVVAHMVCCAVALVVVGCAGRARATETARYAATGLVGMVVATEGRSTILGHAEATTGRLRDIREEGK